MTKPAPAALPVFDPSAAASRARKIQHSMTLQGGALGAAATFVAAKGGPLLIALGVSPPVSGELVGDLAAAMAAIGALMVAIGRLRLGDLK